MLKVYGIKTNDGYYLSDEPNKPSYSRSSFLKSKIINGSIPEETFHKDWVKVSDKPIKIQEQKSVPNTNHRYVLIDEQLESASIPLEFNREDVAYFHRGDYDWVWKDEYSHLMSLYRLEYDKHDDILEDIDFTYIELAEIDRVINPKKYEFKAQTSKWNSDPFKIITTNDAENQMIDKIIFPDLVLGNHPKRFTSKQMYAIVRAYIKENIDGRYARITSDYKFCFTVKKVIPLDSPIKTTVEVMKQNGRPYKKPRFITNYKKNREVEVFEMTHSEENYKGYTPIPAMVGENAEDLKEKVERYCKELIEEINKPFHDCPTCKGAGVILEKQNAERGL